MILTCDRVTVLIESKMNEGETSENLKDNNKIFSILSTIDSLQIHLK